MNWGYENSFHMRSAGGTTTGDESVNLFPSHNHLLVLSPDLFRDIGDFGTEEMISGLVSEFAELGSLERHGSYTGGLRPSKVYFPSFGSFSLKSGVPSCDGIGQAARQMVKDVGLCRELRV